MNIQPATNLKDDQSGQDFAVSALDSPEDWSSACKVLRVLRPNLSGEEFLNDRTRLISEGYHLIGVKVLNEVVAVASYLITPHPTYFRELLIHDMATLEEYQSKGCGSLLLTEIDRIAVAQSCGRCFVHSRTERTAAHQFYRRNGYEDYSAGFIKKYG